MTPQVIDRRQALKKAAVAAGVVAWATPTIQTLAPGSASAAQYTNCEPIWNFVLVSTGPTCTGIAPYIISNVPACCNNHTYFLFASTDAVSCGSLCGGADGTTATIIGSPKLTSQPNGAGTEYFPKNGCTKPFYFDVGTCANGFTAYSLITTKTTCVNGSVFDCTYSVRFAIAPSSSCDQIAIGTVIGTSCTVTPPP